MDKYKRIDDKIATGHQLMESHDTTGACDIMLEAWEDIKSVMTEDRIKDLQELQKKYKWTEFVMNYVQDLEEQLHNAGIDNGEYFQKRIKYCEELLQLSGSTDELMKENTRRAIAESYFALGNQAECDRLFEEWLNDDPAWGWGYIGWSDCYHFGIRNTKPDNVKAERIISKALEVKNLRDRADVVHRAIDIFNALGNTVQIAALKKELNELTSLPENKPVNVIKTGRNEPCPCGSGRKYKKCCGS